MAESIASGDPDRIVADLYAIADYWLDRWTLPPRLDRENARQVAVFQAWRRLAKFDPARGNAWSYASQSARMSIRDCVRTHVRRRLESIPRDTSQGEDIETED